jgi:hypothetical protein
MRMRVTGRNMRFIDESKEVLEEVRDNWGPENRQPATDREMLQWSPQEYRSWIETGRKPVSQDEQAEPNSRQKQIEQAEHFARASDARWGYRSGLTTDEMRGLSLSERFAAASDRLRGYRGSLPADALAGLSSSEQFAARSAHRWASHDPGGRIEDLRRRRSE